MEAQRTLSSPARMARYERLHRYLLCSGLAEARDVLDLAGGDASGSVLLARRARSVVSYDSDRAAVAAARHACYHRNVRFIAGGYAQLPLADACVDVITSFGVIERVNEPDALLSELRRVLRPDGVVIVSVQRYDAYDAPAYVDAPVREMPFDRFTALLQRHFPQVALYGQGLAAASFVVALDEPAAGPIDPYLVQYDPARRATLGTTWATTFVAMCSVGADAPPLPGSVFLDLGDDLLAAIQEDAIHALAETAWSRRALHDETNAVEALVAERDRLRERVTALHREVVEARSQRDLASAQRAVERADAEAARTMAALASRARTSRRSS